ncbi:MAG: aminoglycoside phosphotransferase family protein, partial [Actinomycetes bacterium]
GLTHGQTAVVLPVRTDQGAAAVLKVGWPNPETRHEHLALRAWNGRGAVRLLRADPRRSVLLLERADAARDLTTLPVLKACAVVAELYGALHRPALPQLDRLSVLAASWAERLPRLAARGLVPRRLVEQAAGLARDFALDPATDGTLLHRDLHYENVLAALGPSTDTWVAIDPQPLSGDPAYEVAPLLWNRWPEVLAADRAREALLARFLTVVDAAGLDEERARAWVVVRELVNVCWAVEDAERGRPLDRAWITAATTIVKAVQR